LEVLGIAAGAALSATAVGVASSSWLAKIGWTKLLLGVSAIGAATAVPLSYQAWQRHKAQPVNTSLSHSSVSATQFDVPADRLATPEPRVSTAAEPTSAAAPDTASVKLNPSARGESRSDAPIPGLAEELSALDSARAQLAKGDATGALARLDAYNRNYAKGRLQLEAEVLRIDALSKSGQTSLAKRRAETFLRKYPNSVLASRVRALLGS
jgi:hypothetical protein